MAVLLELTTGEATECEDINYYTKKALLQGHINQWKWLKSVKNHELDQKIKIKYNLRKSENLIQEHPLDGSTGTNSHRLQDRASCPWDVYAETDSHRWPRTLHQARCRCKQCTNKDPMSHCEQVTFNVPVLYRNPDYVDGCNPVTRRYEYVSTYTTVVVGCTCAKLKIHTGR